MTIQLIMNAGEFHEPSVQIDSLDDVAAQVREGMGSLFKMPIANILDVLQNLSRALVRDPEVKKIEGIAFLSNWLRKDNLLRMIEINLGQTDFLDSFVENHHKLIRAFPRGVVCHWIAGNVPTLGLFSLFQSMLTKNGNIVRVPESSLPSVIPILKLLSTLKGDPATGQDLLRSVALVHFPSSDLRSNENMSKCADARVVWGGKEAVDAITNLPRATHCEDVVFGPKYSFAVIDREALESEKMGRLLRNLATDSVLFEQTACSSPHVVFAETDWNGALRLADRLAEEFRRLSSIIPKRDFEMGSAIKIINRRAEYALSPDKAMLAPKENDWSILVDNETRLEEPIQSRTVFMKPVKSVMETIPLVTKNVQTIGNGILNRQKAQEFAEGVMYRGAARVVPLGQMHIHDSPWDGILFLSRLVRWNALTPAG